MCCFSLPSPPKNVTEFLNAATLNRQELEKEIIFRSAVFYLPRRLQVDGDDVEAIAAELAGPAAALTDPL